MRAHLCSWPNAQPREPDMECLTQRVVRVIVKASSAKYQNRRPLTDEREAAALAATHDQVIRRPYAREETEQSVASTQIDEPSHSLKRRDQRASAGFQ